MDRKRFKKQVAFILEADKEKNILRQTHLSGARQKGKRCRACVAHGDDDLSAEGIRECGI